MNRQDVEVIDGQLSFRLSGKKGEILTAQVRPEEAFLGQVIHAIDSSAGTATRMIHLFVGNRLQDIGLGVSTAKFSDPGNLLKIPEIDVCELGQSLAFVVEFLDDCVWNASVYGKMERRAPRKSF